MHVCAFRRATVELKMSQSRGFVTIRRVSTSPPEQSQEQSCSSGAEYQLLPGAAIVQQVSLIGVH